MEDNAGRPVALLAPNDHVMPMDQGSIPAASTKSSCTVEQTSTPGAGKGADGPGVDPPSTGGVYALTGVPGFIKIGKATNIAVRMEGVQTGHPVPLRLLAVLSRDPLHEHVLHAHWRHLRSAGEWYRFDEELLAFVAARRADPDAPFFPALRSVARRFGRSPSSHLARHVRWAPKLSPELYSELAWVASQRERLTGPAITAKLNRMLASFGRALKFDADRVIGDGPEAMCDLAAALAAQGRPHA